MFSQSAIFNVLIVLFSISLGGAVSISLRQNVTNIKPAQSFHLGTQPSQIKSQDKNIHETSQETPSKENGTSATVTVTINQKPMSQQVQVEKKSTLCNVIVFKKLRFSWLNAFKACKSLGNGTELVSIKSAEDFNLITIAAKDTKSPSSVIYWTSGTDLIDEGVYSWMSDGTEINNGIEWGPGQPDNLFETEHCVALRKNLLDSDYKLSDENCLMSGAFICAQRC